MILILKTELLFFILSCIAVKCGIGHPFWPAWSPPFHANEGLAPRWSTFGSQYIPKPQIFRPNFSTFGNPPASNQYFPRHDVLPNPWGRGFNSVKQNFNGGSSSDVHEGFGNEGPKARTFDNRGIFESLLKKVEGIGTGEGLISKGPFPKFEWSKSFEANKVIDSTSKPQFPFKDIWSSKVNSEPVRPWFLKPFLMNANKLGESSSETEAKTEDGQAQNISTEDKVDETENQNDEPAEQTPKAETENQDNESAEQTPKTETENQDNEPTVQPPKTETENQTDESAEQTPKTETENQADESAEQTPKTESENQETDSNENEVASNEDSTETEADESTTKPETKETNTTEKNEEETKSED